MPSRRGNVYPTVKETSLANGIGGAYDVEIWAAGMIWDTKLGAKPANTVLKGRLVSTYNFTLGDEASRQFVQIRQIFLSAGRALVSFQVFERD